MQEVNAEQGAGVVMPCRLSRAWNVIDRGVRVDSQLYHRLLNHTLQAPIDESLTAEKTVTHVELRDQAERLIAERAFYGRLAANAGDSAAVPGTKSTKAFPCLRRTANPTRQTVL